MVARITTPKRIQDALNYNEQKVKKGSAECIHAGNFILDAGQLNFYQKLNVFEQCNSLNDRATTKTLHISLNFDPSEKLPVATLADIASAYIDKIGFGNQPFIVYQHFDAGHPHIHIVTTTIREDGSRINTHNIGRNQSEKARKEIEMEYHLVKAQRSEHEPSQKIYPLDVEKVIYGKSETKRGIGNVVNVVFSQYKFTSLPEFNAALLQYNIVADRGKEDGRIYKTQGLLYRVLDEHGNKVGVPIKASSLSCKPTLARLQEKFVLNEPLKFSFRKSLSDKIDRVLRLNVTDLSTLKSRLEALAVFTVVRQSPDGRPYGITFVDNSTKCVFNGSDLGKSYSVAGLVKQFANVTLSNHYIRGDKDASSTPAENKALKSIDAPNQKQSTPQIETGSGKGTILNELMHATDAYPNVPYQVRKKRKKKRNINRDY